MIIDANIDRQAAIGGRFDVCVGAGPAVATRGFDVALMETGDLEFDSASQECHEGEIVGADHLPLRAARLRLLGGTSNHWGGFCRPMDQIDFAERPGVPLSGWPFDKAYLDPYEQPAAKIPEFRRPPDEHTNHPPERPEDLHCRNAPTTRIGEKYHDELAPFRERLSVAFPGKAIESEGRIASYRRQRRDPNALEGSVELQMEQTLDPESRVRLAELRDRFRLRQVALDWRTNEIGFMTARGAVLNVSVQQARHGMERVKLRDWLLRDDGETRESGDLPGSWHHLCTTRMSADPKLGVVDRNARVHDVGDLFVDGSGVFSTPGQTVPTFTIVQPALRLGDHTAEAARS